MTKKIIYVAVGLAICGLIYLALTNWEAFKATIMGILLALGLYGGGKSALKAKKKSHEKKIKERGKKTDETLKKIGKRTSLKSRVANRNQRARKRKGH